MSLPIFLLLLLSCCGYALLRGGSPERIAALLQVGAYVVTITLHRALEGAGFRSAHPLTAVVDVVLLIALTVLAWRSTRFWPLWIAAWQLATIVAHLAKMLDPSMLSTSYAVQAQIWAYPMLVATAIGAWRHQARLRDGDPDPAWKTRFE